MACNETGDKWVTFTQASKDTGLLAIVVIVTPKRLHFYNTSVSEIHTYFLLVKSTEVISQ
jgi:hypothetical protein